MSQQHKSSQRQERSAAAKLGGRRVAFSGAGEEKGDVSFRTSLRTYWMHECKETAKEDIVVKLSDWKKIQLDARKELKLPLLEYQSSVARFYVTDPATIDELICRRTEPIKWVVEYRPLGLVQSCKMNGIEWKTRVLLRPNSIVVLQFGPVRLVLIPDKVFEGLLADYVKAKSS